MASLASGPSEALLGGAKIGLGMVEEQTRRQAIQMEMINQNIDRVNTAVVGQLKNLQSVYANQNSRTPELEEQTNQTLGGIMETINGLSAIPTKEAQVAKQSLMTLVNTAKMGLKTKGELATEAAQAEDAAIARDYGKAYPGQTPSPAPVQFGIDAAGQPMSTQPQTAQATPGVGAATMPGAPGAGIGPEPALAGPTASAVPPGQVAQQPQVPQVQGNAMELLNIGQIPPRDIEALLANPTRMKPMFESQYGVSADPFFAQPEIPGQNPTLEQYRRAAKGVELPGEKAYWDAKGKDLPKIQSAMNDAKERISINFQQRKLLRQGIYAGWGQDWVTEIQRFRLEFVDDPEAMAMLNRTDLFIQNARAKAAKIIKQFGAGTGLSDADLKFAFQLGAGDISFNEGSLEKFLDLDSRLAAGLLARPEMGINEKGALDENKARLLAAGYDEDEITSFLGK